MVSAASPRTPITPHRRSHLWTTSELSEATGTAKPKREPKREMSKPEPEPGGSAERAWPVTGPAGARPSIERGWEPPPSPWAAGHRGVDLGTSSGATVRAAAAGRVSFAGRVAGRGVLSIELSDSRTQPTAAQQPLRITYEPVRPIAHKGDRVAAGQPVAVLAPGPYHCRAPCLHWGLLRGKTYLDPLSLLPTSMLHPGPSRLLPVFGVPPPRSHGLSPLSEPLPLPHKSPPPSPLSSTTSLTYTTLLAATTLWATNRLRSHRPSPQPLRSHPRSSPTPLSQQPPGEDLPGPLT
ncbi:M23 family metallopeptidase [Streptomyces sp. MST-110588]|nr:M23 family metallopeptidase [Streptomyces sp. MST-110588]